MAGEARLGTVVGGKWRLDELLGEGGMSCVFSASHTTNGYRVAIKVMRPEYAYDERARARFLREASLANRVEHPAVVKIIDDGTTDDDCPYLMMELLHGKTAEQLRASAGGRLPVATALRIAREALSALAVAHDLGLAHRDVKLPNIFVTREGAVRLLDFGTAGWGEKGDENTRTGVGGGTPLYMAPEQFGGVQRIDGRADVFGLGTSLYRMISGVFPFAVSTLAEYALAVKNQRLKKLDALVPDVGKTIADVVARSLAYDVHSRWPDARAMLLALPDLQADRAGPGASDDETDDDATLAILAPRPLPSETLLHPSNMHTRPISAPLSSAPPATSSSGPLPALSQRSAEMAIHSSAGVRVVQTSAPPPPPYFAAPPAVADARPARKSTVLLAVALVALVVLVFATALYARAVHGGAGLSH